RCRLPRAAMALAKAEQLWALLDEMAESDPEAYWRLQRRLHGRPEPHLSLRGRARVRGRGRELSQGHHGAPWPLFINVCSWERVPAPQGPSDPTPISVGRLEEVTEGEALYSIIDVAFNPEVLQKGEENPEHTEHLIRLTLKFVEERCNLVLSDSYTLESFKLKGSLEAMQQRLVGGWMPAPSLNQHTTKELTLDQLLQTAEAEDAGKAPVLLREEGTTQSKAHLIEEIASCEKPEGPSTPSYELTTVRDANENPLRMELRVELPQVSSVAECDLSISK
ncbi:PIHD2 protein, partial [Piaya cayana]|nr:PIHD2 protein [Piaya cayana]